MMHGASSVPVVYCNVNSWLLTHAIAMDLLSCSIVTVINSIFLRFVSTNKFVSSLCYADEADKEGWNCGEIWYQIRCQFEETDKEDGSVSACKIFLRILRQVCSEEKGSRNMGLQGLWKS